MSPFHASILKKSCQARARVAAYLCDVWAHNVKDELTYVMAFIVDYSSTISVVFFPTNDLYLFGVCHVVSYLWPMQSHI